MQRTIMGETASTKQPRRMSAKSAAGLGAIAGAAATLAATLTGLELGQHLGIADPDRLAIMPAFALGVASLAVVSIGVGTVVGIGWLVLQAVEWFEDEEGWVDSDDDNWQDGEWIPLDPPSGSE